MRILTNAYESNVPKSNKVSQGGTANFSRALSNFLIEHNHEWIGLIIKPEKIKNPNLSLLFEKEGRSFWKLTSPKKRNLFKNTKNLSAIEDFFKPTTDLLSDFLGKIKPDVIFLNGAYLNPWLILKAGAKLNIPIVTKHPGIWKKELERNPKLYTENGLKNLLEMEKDFSKLSSREIFLNDWSRKVYQKEVFRVNNARSEIISLPISPVKNSGKKQPNKKNYNIGVVARWDRIKNHQAVLALAKLAEEKKLPWTFYSVTSIPPTNIHQEFKENYKRYIRVEEPKNRQELNKFYKKMDLMILPSHFDVSPHVVPEALFNGTPTLISPNVGWVSDYQRTGAKNWIIDFGNPEKVVERVLELKNTPLPEKLLKILKNNSDPEYSLKKFLNVFKKVKRKL
ncbi:glycosyltransferase [Patescibacteria group bacterium]|nr:glycosyltransferase [Patescibacteria group bacterium]